MAIPRSRVIQSIPVTPPQETEKNVTPPRRIKSAAPHGLALFRIAFGITLTCQLLFVLRGAAQFELVEWLLLLGGILMSALFTAGAWFPYTAVALICIYGFEGSILLRAGAAANTFTSMYQVSLFVPLLLLLVWSRADRAYSHAMYLKYGSFSEWEEVRALPVTILKIVISIAYLYIATVVLWQPVWMSGARMRSALIGSLGTTIGARLARMPFPPFFFNSALSVTKAFVLMLPFSLWIRSVRKFTIILGFVLQLFIGLLLGEWWLFALASGMVLFVNPNEVRLFVEKKMKKNG